MTRTVAANIASLVEEDPVNNSRGALTCGSCLLDAFCRFNWVGPNLNDLSCPYPNSGTKTVSVREQRMYSAITLPLSASQSELNLQSLEALSCDGEVYITRPLFYLKVNDNSLLQPVYPLCRHPLLLWLAHAVLVDNSSLLGPSAVRLSLSLSLTSSFSLGVTSAPRWCGRCTVCLCGRGC